MPTHASLQPELTPENPERMYLHQISSLICPWAGMSNRDRNILNRCCHQIQHIIRLLVALNHFRARRLHSSPGLRLPSSPTPATGSTSMGPGVVFPLQPPALITVRWEQHKKSPQKVHCNHQLSFPLHGGAACHQL